MLFQFITAAAGIIFIGAIPQLFHRGESGFINFPAYGEAVQNIVTGLLHLGEMTYNVQGTIRPLFPIMLEMFFYSITILFSALMISLIFATLLTFFTMLLPHKVIEKMKFGVFLFESLPDILIIVLLQVAVIKFFQSTGILLFSIATIQGEKAYLLPILTLAILPTIQFYKLMILIFEEELEKQYVELARGKGLRKGFILLVHVWRNAGISIFYHSKSLLWFMLSNLLILEYLFNIPGITGFLMNYLTPEIFTVGLFLFFVPFFFMYAFGEYIVLKLDKGEGSKV